MFIIIWKFTVRKEREEEFEEVYGPDGEWAKLFRLDNSYQGTRLLVNTGLPGEYLTIDQWTSEEAYNDFHLRFKAEYRALDERCESLTENESLIGRYTSCQD